MGGALPRRGSRIETPIGTLVGVIDARGALVELDFEDPEGPMPPPEGPRWGEHDVTWSDTALTSVRRALEHYCAGGLVSFDLAVAPTGDDFHRQVWRRQRRIPYGETISYGELARRVGRAGAARAVGRAKGSNPIAIVIPCHRVIGADGRLTGYSGGIERKAALLALERPATPQGQETLPWGISARPGGRVRQQEAPGECQGLRIHVLAVDGWPSGTLQPRARQGVAMAMQRTCSSVRLQSTWAPTAFDQSA